MLVYGDRTRPADPRAKLDRVEAGWRAAAEGAGLARHEALVGALIEAGELAQGLADAEFEARGCDADSPAANASAALCLGLAHAVRGSWRGGLPAALGPPPTELAGLRPWLDGGPIRTKPAEGYAFYALYPEAYLEAAEAVPTGERPTRVIGLRSIGVSLGAMVAAGLAAPAFTTVRPVGHPFRRSLALCACAGFDPGQTHAVVDEGPGLSGSSFAAVAERLEAAGAPPRRIHLFPGHGGGPGPEADPGLRSRWARWPRHQVGFEQLALGRDRRLERWVEDLVGAPLAPLEDLSGGAWRGRLWADEADWPPVWAAQERRKYLLRTASGAWLLKYAGLGAAGREALARAQALHQAGFGPETPGLRHGFLVQRWLEGARPLDPHRCDRAALVARLGDYLAFRQRRFSGAEGAGADLETLWRMARANIDEALGELESLDAWKLRLPALARGLRPMEIDGRLHPWEWLETPAGLVKTDAVDHCRAHDLVGRQDIAWDLAGAAAEFELSPGECAQLAARVAGVRPELLAFMDIAYRAFQLGRCAMARASAPPAEAARLAAAEARYVAGLRPLIAP